MLKGAVARRYAAAMFELARKQNTLDRTLADVQGIAELFSNRKISYLLREPKVPAQRKEKAIREGLQKRILPTSLNLALLLIQRELVEYAPNIAAELEQLVLDYRNEAVADVTTATQVDNKQTSIIQQALEQRTGKKIIVQPHVDPSILGGVIARVGDQVIDGSIRYRLNLLEQHMLSSVASSHTEFFSQEELAETVREIGSVDTENAQGTITDYGAIPAIAQGSAETNGQEDYNTVPNSKPTVNRS
ncbi:MAG: hypothetical protein NVS4B12_14140 [Ktedonobacteraceae bacterium]